MKRSFKRLPYAPRRSMRWWTLRERAALLDMREAGATWKDIAELLGREPSAVRDKWFRLTQPTRGSDAGLRL